jgi:hypothetical protein
MRTVALIAIMFSVSSLKAQSFLPGSYAGYMQQAAFTNSIRADSALAKKKWSFNSYSAINTSFTFFKGGNAAMVSVPIGVQVNRKLNDNLYAFANVSVAPSYINFNQAFVNSNFGQPGQNNAFTSNRFGMYSSASMGLMYVNDAKTFSISDSISVERSSYPMVPYYPINERKTNPVSPANR